MIIIAASNKTNKTLSRLLCKNWKHVAPIVANNNKLTLYQFTRAWRHATPINLQWRDMKILEQHGWIFIPLPYAQTNTNIEKIRAVTCVAFTKRAIGLSDIKIQTPNQLIKAIIRQKLILFPNPPHRHLY